MRIDRLMSGFMHKGKSPQAPRGMEGDLLLALCLFSLAGCSTVVRVPPSAVAPAQAGAFDHTAFDRVLTPFVTADGLVNYAGMKADPQNLNEYLALVARHS